LVVSWVVWGVVVFIRGGGRRGGGGGFLPYIFLLGGCVLFSRGGGARFFFAGRLLWRVFLPLLLCFFGAFSFFYFWAGGGAGISNMASNTGLSRPVRSLMMLKPPTSRSCWCSDSRSALSRRVLDGDDGLSGEVLTSSICSSVNDRTMPIECHHADRLVSLSIRHSDHCADARLAPRKQEMDPHGDRPGVARRSAT